MLTKQQEGARVEAYAKLLKIRTCVEGWGG